MAKYVCSVCGYDPSKSYTYKTYTSVSPSNWNELTYQDNNDTQIMSYLGSSFFNYDFKYDKEGNILLEQMNVEITEHKCTGHAETQLAERASKLYDRDFLWECTLYTTAEPCSTSSFNNVFVLFNSP